MFERFEYVCEGFFPFTPLGIVWRKVDKRAKTILDIGCGKGQPARFINRSKRFWLICCDIFKEYLLECTKRKINAAGYVLCDARKLPFKDSSFDIVLCIRLLEHLNKSEGRQLIQHLQRIAVDQVIICTPVGAYPQQPYDDNPYQRHQAIWTPTELRSLGYKVIGNGLPFLLGDRGLALRFPILRAFLAFFWVLVGPLVCKVPEMAGNMVLSPCRVILSKAHSFVKGLMTVVFSKEAWHR
jgi:SAM-dependent methyltransferase